MKKKKIIIVSGDPNSVNSEIIAKCWKKLNRSLYSQYGDIWILMLIFSSLLANVFSKAVKNYE